MARRPYWNQHVYVGDSEVLHRLAVRDGKLELPLNGGKGPVDSGATPTISANADHDGIVWTISTRDWEPIPESLAVLHAYDATDVSRELYRSDENSDRDRAGISVRFTIPTVVNGRVYVGAQKGLRIVGGVCCVGCFLSFLALVESSIPPVVRKCPSLKEVSRPA
jgi:hypothetical protein